MILFQAIEAYKAVTELMDCELDYMSAYRLVAMKRQLKPHVDFFAEEEMKLVQEYGKKNNEGLVEWMDNGTFYFADQDAADAYSSKRLELGNLVVNTEIQPITIKAPERIRATIIEELEGIVTFEEVK